MGKQRSFIIVSLSFIVFIILILLVKVITSGMKETKISFQDTSYSLEIGTERALAPDVYASGDVKDFDFSFSTDNPDVISLQLGSYSKGQESVKCWSFIEQNDKGESITQDTTYPYNESDVITVVDKVWYINGEKTTYKAQKNYTESEVLSHIGPSENEVQVLCYILNGTQTDYPYEEDVIPTRNSETGTWFIKGKDTGYSYKGMVVAIKAESIGEAQLTMTGTIDGKEYSASTTIKVVAPNPDSVVLDSKYEDAMMFVKKGENFTIDYKVKAAEGSTAEPLQDVKFSTKDQTVVSCNENILKAEKIGNTTITITAANSSFTGKYEIKSTTITVVVLDTDDETLISKIKAAYKAINEIGTVTKSDKTKERLDAAKLAIDDLKNYNESYADSKFVTNFAEYEKKYNQYIKITTEE